jgi:hypothetical protein
MQLHCFNFLHFVKLHFNVVTIKLHLYFLGIIIMGIDLIIWKLPKISSDVVLG